MRGNKILVKALTDRKTTEIIDKEVNSNRH